MARQICEERISEEYRCDRCGGVHPAVRRSRLVRLPPVLAVHLQRQIVGPMGPVKDPAHIKFPLRFDATSLCAQARPTPSPASDAASASTHAEADAPQHKVTYALMSVVVHIGGAFGGHYISYRRLPRPKLSEDADAGTRSTKRPGSGRWVYASDEHVKPVTTDTVKGCQAYMLLYARSDSRADHSGGSKGIERDEGLGYWDVSGGGHRLLNYTFL
jgi:ubiquitin C-terminal hydrolase